MTTTVHYGHGRADEELFFWTRVECIAFTCIQDKGDAGC